MQISFTAGFFGLGWVHLQAACLCEKPESCEVTVNVADWLGKRKGNIQIDSRPGEIGWHSVGDGSVAKGEFLNTPHGRHPKILRYFTDVYSIFTGRDYDSSKPQRGVALHAVHSKSNFDFSQLSIQNCTDCIYWLQTPVGQARHVQRYIGNLPLSLLNQNAVWIKLAVFSNLSGEEVQSESTTSFEFCYERVP